MSAISAVTSPLIPPASPPPENAQPDPAETQGSGDTNNTSQTEGSNNTGATTGTEQPTGTQNTTPAPEPKPANDPNSAPTIAAKSQIAANAEVQNPVNDAEADTNGDKLNLRVPLIDEIPDRPLPGFPTPGS